MEDFAESVRHVEVAKLLDFKDAVRKQHEATMGEVVKLHALTLTLRDTIGVLADEVAAQRHELDKAQQQAATVQALLVQMRP
jgi:hypothetical protein